MPSAAPDRRVYTDERFPFLEIHNYGGTKFDIFEKSEETGNPLKIDDFIAYERAGWPQVSQEFAQRRANTYFDFVALKHTESGPEEPEAVPIRTVSRPGPGNPLSGMREMTPQDIDSVIAQAQSEPDPAKAAALRQQALSMMQQQESAAQRVARILLSL